MAIVAEEAYDFEITVFISYRLGTSDIRYRNVPLLSRGETAAAARDTEGHQQEHA